MHSTVRVRILSRTSLLYRSQEARAKKSYAFTRACYDLGIPLHLCEKRKEMPSIRTGYSTCTLSIFVSPASTRRTTCARYGSFISNAYRISDRVCVGIELLVMSNRARRLREA